MLIISSAVITGLGQNGGNERAADSTLRGSGRVNSSTLGMEFEIPLGSYPGRGIDVPINLSYSSKLWRMTSLGNNPIPGSQSSDCYPHYLLRYAENSASGWTTSLGVPWIEFVGQSDHYDSSGNPATDADVTCPTSQGGGGPYPFFYVRRIVVHMPSGETHELRPDDTAIESPPNGSTGSSPYNWANWNADYYAIDGSNLKYIQNSSTGTCRLLMPDGSFYDFNSTTWQATGYTDRNGNHTTYHAPDTNYPHGRWVDTLGRSIPIPGAPSSPTTAANPQVYSLPGMTGSYKFQWKQLNGGTQAESALTDISHPDYQLKYTGETYVCGNPATYCSRPAGTYLFNGTGQDLGRIVDNSLFNPVVLTEIELPTGHKYRFSYDVYGRIEWIHYPTGGKEQFIYGVVPTLSVLNFADVTWQTNFGVTTRKVYESETDSTPYVWTYSGAHVSPQGYQVTINNPDGTKVERYLHRGNDDCQSCGVGTFGYDNGLAGMAYEESVYDNSGPAKLVSKKLTNWTVTTKQLTMQTSGGSYPGQTLGRWHPRVESEESIVYDPAANGISATTTFAYEGDLDLRDTPVLMKRSSQYAFVQAGSPLPANPVKISENTFLINDSNYSSVKANYTNQNMVGLITASQMKDSSGTIVSRSETVYDDTSNYPIITPSQTPTQWTAPANGYRGNPNTVRVWDSTKGLVTNSSAYIETHARFDNFGNQRYAWDALGNQTTTDFDMDHYAFPIQVTSPVPDTNGTYGTSSAFVTSATFDSTTGLPLTTTDANGLRTEIEYDETTLRPRYVRYFDGSTQIGPNTETIYHDESGNYWVKSRSQIDADHWAETITYFDGLGRAWKTEEINSNGNIFVEKEFDAEGRVKRVTNPFRANETKYWTTNVYDEASRVKEVILQDGATVKTDYGVSTTAPIGVTKQITDQAGKKRKGYTDALGNMVRVIEDPAGTPLNTDYVFDTLGNLRKTTQGEQSRYFWHDSLGRLLYARQVEQDANANFSGTNYTDPVTGNNQWSVRYVYDDNSNITSTTDTRNITVTAYYDHLNRINLRDYSDSTPDVSFYYDGKGLPSVPDFSRGKTTKVTSSTSETTYRSFDIFGRLLSQRQTTDGVDYDTAYTYNLSGALIEQTYPSGRVVKNTFDENADLSQVQSGKCLDAAPVTNGTCTNRAGLWSYASGFASDAAGNLLKMQFGNGRWENFTYNNRQQIIQIGLGSTDSTQDLLKLELGYGSSTQNNGSLRSQKISFDGLEDPFEQTYGYDDLNRLQVAEEKVSGSTTWKQTFTIDRYGNRRFDANNTTTLGSCSTAVCNPTISTSTNRISSTGYSFDPNGSITQDATGQRFGYDAENHQKEFYAATNQGSTPDATYFYDGSGLRVKKISASETTVFVYDASSKLIAEYSTEISQTPQVSYLTTDHLGSPRVITNENGAVTSRKDFTAFGEESATAERTPAIGYSGAAEIRQGYTGYEKDDESGLDFAQARYYSSTHGRFTSVDPLTASGSIRNPQTFNRYSYVLNSPYKFVDPLGLLSVATSACAGSCANNEQNLDVRRAGGHDSSAADYFENQQIQQQPQTPPSQQGAFQVNGAALRFGEFIVSGTVSENNVTFNVGADSAAPPGLEGLMGGKTQFSVELSLTSESAVDVVPTDVKTYSIDKDRPHDMTTTYNQNSSRMTPIGKDEGTNNIADIPPPSLKDPSETRSSPPPGQVDFKNTKFVGRKLSTTATFNAQFSTGAVDSPRHSNSVLVKIVGRNSNNKFVTERIKVTINFNVPSTR